VVLAALGLGAGCTALKRCAYEGFGRDDWQQPERVVAALGLEAGDHVADLGAGGGYFTFRLARAVGPGGRVYAVDVDEGMLEHIRERAQAEGFANVEPVLAVADDSGLPPASTDLVFVSNTWHHLPEPRTYFARLAERLRPGGRVAVVELREGGFPPGHHTAPEAIRADLEAAGYHRVAAYDFLDRQSFQIFARGEGL
jgi:ubiquinone/menaquinone biosynthesis C-methylase UbiE